MKKIRWGVIGAGGIAHRRAIPALLLDEQNELAAIMDRVPKVARSIAEEYRVADYFDDAEGMLKAVPCDAVYMQHRYSAITNRRCLR